MKLDYQITHLLHPHYVKEYGCVYDHIKWTIWFSNDELLNEINESFDYDFKLEEKNEVMEKVAYEILYFIQNKKKYFGTIGDEYDRNILDIYNDYEA